MRLNRHGENKLAKPDLTSLGGQTRRTSMSKKERGSRGGGGFVEKALRGWNYANTGVKLTEQV